MYQVIFSVNNNEEFIVLPYVPPDFPLSLPEQHNETYTGLSRDYRRIGTIGLRQLEWSAFFPVEQEMLSFMPPYSTPHGWLYVDFFNRWRKRKVPFRLVVLDNYGVSRLNMPCTVDKFDFSIRVNGWIDYSITLTEYRFIANGQNAD